MKRKKKNVSKKGNRTEIDQITGLKKVACALYINVSQEGLKKYIIFSVLVKFKP